MPTSRCVEEQLIGDPEARQTGRAAIALDLDLVCP